tara:strand:+ start:13635 stop:14453 length:819 start_codon:yes stop_codon:yes gene_type:complete
MALQSSGAISLNEMHIEAGGSSGSQCTVNDSDIRGLIGKGSGAQMAFNEWYGASAVNDCSFNGSTITKTHQFIQNTYTTKGYCGSGSRGSLGYFQQDYSGGGTASDRIFQGNGSTKWFLVAAMASNVVNTKFGTNTYEIELFFATRYTGTGFNTTALPAGVTGFGIYGDPNPWGVIEVWYEVQNLAFKVNGTQYAAIPAYNATSNAALTGNGINLRGGGAQNPSQSQIDVESMDDYHCCSWVITDTHSSTGSTTIGSNILNEFTGNFTVEFS